MSNQTYTPEDVKSINLFSKVYEFGEGEEEGDGLGMG